MRTYVHFDGFNLYYGALKMTACRRADLERVGRVRQNDAGQPHGACLTAEPRISSPPETLVVHAGREAERPLATFQIQLEEAQ